jgi:methylenetetrahydrofolate reductase (NADPH)
MSVLKKQARNITKLLTLQEPDKLVRDLAEYKSQNPDCGIEGAHVYPLGGLERSAAWSYATTAGDIEQRPEGFKVYVDI